MSSLAAIVRALLRDQRVAFLLVGGVNTLVGYGFFALIHLTVGDQLGYLGTLVGAYALGLVVAFTTHRRFVFKVRGNVMRDYARFVVVQLVALGLNAVLLTALVEFTSIPVLVAQAVALGLAVVLSYFGHLFFSFHRPADESTHSAARLGRRHDHRRSERQVATGEKPPVD